MHYDGDIGHRAKLSTLKTSVGMLLGQFAGPAVLFTNFAARLIKHWSGSWDLGDARLMLDKVLSADSYVKTNQRSLNQAAWFVKHLPKTIIVLLELKRPGHQDGSKDSKHVSGQWEIGLSPGQDSSSEPQKSQFWKRVGVFIWSVEFQRQAAGIALDPIKALIREVEEDVTPVLRNYLILRGDDPI
jgi:hypothetical protein